MPSWWESLFRKQTMDARMDAELRFHVEQAINAHIAAGVPPQEARRRAMLEFGGHEQILEELRDVHRVDVVDKVVVNLRSAFRFLRKYPSFSAAVILTLALGIGANSAVFSAIDAILLRPLPFPDGDQLMALSQYNPRINAPETFVAPIRVEDWNRLTSTFQSITGYYTESASETSGALPEKLSRAWVAPRFLQVWAVSPALGRDFAPQEERVGGPPAILISDRLWRRRFGADLNVVGRTLRLDGYAFPIIGVMPPSFRFPVHDVDLWSPIPPDSPYGNRDSTWYTVIGRLKPSVTLAEARADMTLVQARLGKSYPKPDADLAVAIHPLKELAVGDSRHSLWMLFAAVSLLLLIACTNIAALLLARATQRQHEIAIRFSLGASRGAVVAQLLSEAFVLSLLGALLGFFVAGAASDIFRYLADGLPRVDEIRLDWRIMVYSLVCSVLATLLCGLVPALRGTRSDLSTTLAQASRAQVAGRGRLQWLLVGIQVALAVTLLAGAGLLVRSFRALGRVSPGFDSSHVLTFHVNASWGETGDMKKLIRRIDGIIETLRSTPGVDAAATTSTLPGEPNKYQTQVEFTEGQPDTERKIVAESRFVSRGYFETLRIPLLGGEMCGPDPASSEALVNRSFADTYVVGDAVLGRHLRIEGNSFVPASEIRGIVGDARETGLNRAPIPTIYWCVSAPVPDPFYLVRTRIAPMAMAETVRQRIHEIEPNRSVFDLMPLEKHLDSTFAETRLRTVLLAFFAATAVSLASIGLYGTLAYSVNVRRREVGLRLALGASRGRIMRRFLWGGLGVTLIGCFAGGLLALSSTRLLAGMLYGVSPSDPVTLVGVILLAFLVAAPASLLPAMRAARLDPIVVLREE